MGKGNWEDLIAFGFITLWIVLCSGKPDLIDAVTVRLMGDQAVYEKIKGEK
jgi:hypothetical protein